VVLLQRGRVAAAGSKAEMLTSERLSAIFGAPIALERRDGYYSAST
jgi:iron complex transport system ATP-binding protein